MLNRMDRPTITSTLPPAPLTQKAFRCRDKDRRTGGASVTAHYFLHSLVRCRKCNRSSIDAVHKGVECSSLLISIHSLQEAVGVEATEVNHANSACDLLRELFGQEIEPLTALLCTLQRRPLRHLGHELLCPIAFDRPFEAPILNKFLKQLCVLQLRTHYLAVDKGCEHSPIGRSKFFVPLLQLLGQLVGRASGPIRRFGNQPNRQSTRCCYRHCSPVGHIPPFDFERAYLHRSFSLPPRGADSVMTYMQPSKYV